jgi:hypothetical protein
MADDGLAEIADDQAANADRPHRQRLTFLLQKN